MFLRNGWYTALWSHELTDKPVGKTFLNEKVVLFRNASGQVGALEDCCCHRAAPLSMGEVAGDHLRLRLSRPEVRRERAMRRGAGPDRGAGRRQGAQLSGAREEQHRLDLDGRCRPRPTPPRSPTCRGCPIRNGRRRRAGFYVKTNYQFIIDNLLDLTHVAHVHKKTIAGDPREATTPTKTERLQRRRACRPLDDRFRAAAAVRQGRQLQRKRRPLAVRDLAPARRRLSRRRLRQGRHRRAAGRPQPGHLDLVEPPDHARDRAHQPLHVRLLARLQNRRPGDVEAAVRGLARDLPRRRRISRGGAGAIGSTARSTA